MNRCAICVTADIQASIGHEQNERRPHLRRSSVVESRVQRTIPFFHYDRYHPISFFDNWHPLREFSCSFKENFWLRMHLLRKGADCRSTDKTTIPSATRSPISKIPFTSEKPSLLQFSHYISTCTPSSKIASQRCSLPQPKRISQPTKLGEPEFVRDVTSCEVSHQRNGKDIDVGIEPWTT